ncbi:hypothetical protein SEA_IBANTIK_100 [Streptomyces phage Ibantik]|uniref:Uncharacterized protein n=1 Tax=Streptomyces phage Ibantik TaxID=2182397 RepID=A0A2U8UNL5_9CAUD|nr:hypothetical protein QEH36_gp065 [Streptomyces phage Ibantik]AWN05329.1 hypothetical protein SEA_IBANTIK_100 [Streptomyces phage Ibantik]
MGDEFGWCQGWRFALCDYLTSVWGEDVPEFRQGAHGPEEDAYEYQALEDMQPSPGECWYALRILDRYRVWLGLAGKDY